MAVSNHHFPWLWLLAVGLEAGGAEGDGQKQVHVVFLLAREGLDSVFLFVHRLEVLD